MKQDIEILKAGNTGDIFKDAPNIIKQTRNYAYQAVNVAMMQRNWLLGKRIADEELQDENRAGYGKEIIKAQPTFCLAPQLFAGEPEFVTPLL